MASDLNHKTPSTSTEEQTSSSSSGDSNSTPNTPPSPTVLPRTPPQHVSVPPQQGQYTPSPTPKRSPPKSTPKSRLGAIDEDSDAVSPDVPLRNPRRKMGLPSIMKFAIPNIPTLHGTRRPPKNLYDDVEGPKGEKFSDVRTNKKVEKPKERAWKTLICIGCLILILGAVLAIGLIVGLKVRHNKKAQQNASNNSSSSGINTGFPAGQYSIASYLNDVDTSCTSHASTWRCYPYATYNQSTSTSLSVLSWIIASRSNGTYVISSADPVFSYPFQNVSLTRMNNGSDGEYWTFNTLFDKSTFPTTSLTSDGTASKCFFNNTKLEGRLYTKMSKTQALQNSTTSTGGSSNTFQAWPYALYFEETHASGDGVPNCYEYVNSQIGRPIDLNYTLSNTGLTSNCECQYTNFFPVPS